MTYHRKQGQSRHLLKKCSKMILERQPCRPGFGFEALANVTKNKLFLLRDFDSAVPLFARDAASGMPETDSPQRRRSAGGTNENAQGKRSLAQASPRRSPPQKQRAALSALSPQQFGENPPLTAEHDTFGRSPLRGPSVQPVGPTQRGTFDARLSLSVYRRAYADVAASSCRA